MKRTTFFIVMVCLCYGFFVNSYAQTRRKQSESQQKTTQPKKPATPDPALNQKLMVAVSEGDLASVKALLAKGADVNTMDIELDSLKLTPLMPAAEPGVGGGIGAMIPKGLNVTPLMLAAARGHLDIVQELLAKKCDVNAKASALNFTALMFAAMTWHKEIVEILLDKGADIDAKAADYITPLMFAACGLKTFNTSAADTVKVLLDKKTQVDTSDAYHLADTRKHADIVLMLKPNASSWKFVEGMDHQDKLNYVLRESQRWISAVGLINGLLKVFGVQS